MPGACGRATVEKLHRLGIQTIGELAEADEGMIRSHLKKYGQTHLLLSLSETVAARLRGDGVMVSVVSVHLTTCEFEHMGRQMQLDSPTNLTTDIYDAACGILGKLWDKKTPIRQIGVHTAKVQSDVGRQYSIFDLEKSDKLEKLDQTIDRIRSKN